MPHYLTQRALVQLDGQLPVSSTRNQPLRSEHHGNIELVSRSPGGGLGSRPRMATMNKKYNNLLTTSVVQGIKAKIHSRPTSMTLPRSTSGRRSTKAVTRGVLLKQGEGIVPAGATTTTTRPFPRFHHQHDRQVLSKGLHTSRNPEV
jgi:hypothetical protein